MNKRLFIIISLIFLSSHTYAQAIKVKADENVELMSILARLAGFPEYCMNMAGQYVVDIINHFNDEYNHPAVIYMKELRKEHGVSYDAVMSMAIHLNNQNGTFKLIEEEANTLEERWQNVDKEKFLALLSQFYHDTHFKEFFNAHQTFYQKGISAFSENVMKYFDSRWYESFYGHAPDEIFSVIIGFPNGGGNYGSRRHIKGQQKEVFAILGFIVDKKNNPIYNKEDLSTLIHEFNHSFINPFLDERKYPNHIKALKTSVTQLFLSSQWAMSKQAYGDWETLINESLVRAAVICYMLDKKYPKEEIEAELSEQLQRNFRWMPELVALLREYEKHRNKYPTFEKFYPQIISFFNAYAEKEREEINSLFND